MPQYECKVVNGHLGLPAGGQEFSPSVVAFFPIDGHEFSLVVQFGRGITPFPVVAWASR